MKRKKILIALASLFIIFLGIGIIVIVKYNTNKLPNNNSEERETVETDISLDEAKMRVEGLTNGQYQFLTETDKSYIFQDLSGNVNYEIDKKTGSVTTYGDHSNFGGAASP